jgi:hypothetical protein
MTGKYLTANKINFGDRVIPIKKVGLFSPDVWEEFTEEWLDTKSADYIESERFGGAGDMGRDIVAYKSDKKIKGYKWDCYQCKHYTTSLMPTQVYVEFGKILYYTFKNEFPIPDNYYFVAPLGVGTSLSALLQDEKKLKKAVIDNWNGYCKKKISSVEILLEGNFLDYVVKFDFSIFDKINVKTIIEEHKDHNNHLTRFGGGLPDRERLDESKIPDEVQKNEASYVNQLYEAYGSHSGIKYKSYNDFKSERNYSGHFKRSRINFHYAEQLRNFSRDSLPLHTFEDFQNEILSAVIDISESDHSDGFARVKQVEKEARNIIISSNPLKDVSLVNDRSGVCHQLANDNKLKWS